MKFINKLKYIFLAAAMVFSYACDDITDIDPKDVLDPTLALQNIDDYEDALLGVYAQYRNMYNFSYLSLPEMMSDNTRETIESLANFVQETNWLYTSDGLWAADAWSAPYTAINRANIIINGIEKVEEKTAGQKNRILGQALALRAFAHFELLKFFGQSYDRNSTALGVTVKTQSNLEYPARNTVQETYDAIFADLLQARTLLESVDTPIKRPTRVNLTVVNAMLARISLYSGQWTDAISYATAVINAVPLSDRSVFPTIWDADATGEVIWSIAYTSVQEGRIGVEFWSPQANRNSFSPSNSLIALYDQENDIRFDSYIGEVPDRTPLPTTVVKKYTGRGGSEDGVVNAKIFRTGEMYLIRAEAYARNNQEALSLQDLNTLRAARIAGYVNENITGTNLLTAIANERRKELAFEGHRWFDLRRTGQPLNRGEDCVAPTRACVLPANSNKFVWPIPQAEIQNNPAMGSQQNEGY